MKILNGTDAILASVGASLGTSAWVPVTQDRVDLFAEATGDHQWIHVDPERAANGPFGGTIAHGYLTVSVIPVFLADLYRLEGVSSVLNYGLERVRFPAPLPVGSRVRGTVVLAEAVQAKGGVLMSMDVTVECEGAARPVCVARVLHLAVPE
ncbi:MaoC family dehydratase [Nocardioides zeae]|uniref:MaoC family dehydratase n=1 Tax=Nocardioides imazamoxiresistens TaxID=3231893 RepID=A0ABU3PTL0_9ACTN|nr:MaoC family dehydratase [Nocardioides zeae]MDT9592182.1 MaoC family dehydratase [Nocardioides zeae]